MTNGSMRLLDTEVNSITSIMFEAKMVVRFEEGGYLKIELP